MRINEIAYPGNIGVMEVAQFMQLASNAQQQEFQDLIASKQYKQAWQLVQDVTGVRLHGKEYCQ